MADLPYIRAVYFTPWRKGSLAKPSMVARRVDVAVRPATTFAGEAMLHPQTNLTTVGAALAGVGRIGEDRGDAWLSRFVCGEILQLSERPAMEPRAHPQARFGAGADVGEVFHGDGARSDLDGLGDDLFAHDVVYVTHMPGFSARDFPQELLSALRAVGLEASAKGKMLVTFVPELLAAPDFARVGGGKLVLSDIDPEDGAGSAVFDLLFEDEIEEQLPLAAVKLGFLRRAPGKQSGLMLARPQRDRDALAEGVEREAVTLQGEGALVEMDRGAAKVDRRDGLVLGDLAIGFQRLVGRSDAAQYVAAHLRPERRLGAQSAIRQGVELEAVPAARLDNGRDQQVAGGGIGGLQGGERSTRRVVGFDLDRDRAQCRGFLLRLRHLSPLLHVLGSLNVFADRLRANIARCADIVGRGPQMSAPQPLLQRGEPGEQLTCRGSLQDFHRIGHRDRWRDRDEQVDVIGLDFLGQNRPGILLANRVDQFRHRLRHFAGQHVTPIFRHPYHMVGCLENTIACAQHFWHNHMVSANCASRNRAFLPRLKSQVSNARYL